MQTVGLSWEHSGELAVVLAAGGTALALSARPRVRAVGAFLRETAVIAALYGLWRLAGYLAVSDAAGGLRRAHWIANVEAYLGLPPERSIQNLILGHPLLVQAANLYYAAMHLSTMGAFLIWLFVRHRDRYRPVRHVMAWTTLACLLVQLVPVAPPRMMPWMVDTGLRYGQSVYSSGFAVDQMAAMPSVHVAWAVLIGYYVWRISRSRWRFAGPLHAALICFVVVATGNHWELDGIVAVALLAGCAAAVHGVRIGWRAAAVRVPAMRGSAA